MLRKLFGKLMMLDPAYRKACFLEQKLDRKLDLLKAAIDAAKPADRTDEIKAAIEAAKVHDRTEEIKLAIEAAKSVDRTDEIKAAIDAAKPADRADEIKAAIDAARLQDRTDEIKEAIDAVRVALFRNDIKCRWQVLDAFENMFYPPSTPVKCLICGHEAPKSTYETKVSVCIFGGGRLERFVCPECGCIFGPLKMMSLSQEQLGEEYKQSYSVYRETDCTFLEKPTFEALSPVKEGVYLNYGAGAWNKTTVELREAGWQVYDYEPYAPAEGREWVIRSREQLAGMKFDGIFSNDLLEHFRDPIASLLDMKSLLKPNGKMAHTTGCYDYEYPYTRFHFVFFTGGSLDVVSKKIGMAYDLGGRVDERFPSRLCLFK